MVGVILNFAIWFALHVLFSDVREVTVIGLPLDIPVLNSINLPSLILTLGALLAVFRFKVGMIPVLAVCSAAGVILHMTIGVVH